jgi:predicted transcriptional regulator YheO
VELGPFSSSSRGPVDDVADAVAAMIRSAMAAGATALRIQIGADPADLDGVGSLQHALEDMIRAAERELDAPATQWDRTQKQAVVRMLHERGAFLLRGAVDDIAEVMGVSRITIYNYLNAIE